MRIAVAVTILALMTFVSTPLFAQTDEELQRGQEHFDAGGKLYFEGKYSEALVEFRKGYALTDNPMFLYNIALCHFRLEEWTKAIDANQEALASGSLDEATAMKATGRNIALRARITSEQVSREVRSANESAQLMAQMEDSVDTRTVEAGADDSRGRFGPLGWVGVTTTVLGGVVLAGFGVVELGLADDVEAYKAAADRGDALEAERIAEDIETTAELGRMLLYSGGGVAALGLTLIVVDLVTVPERNTVSIVPVEGGAVVRYGVSF